MHDARVVSGEGPCCTDCMVGTVRVSVVLAQNVFLSNVAIDRVICVRSAKSSGQTGASASESEPCSDS